MRGVARPPRRAPSTLLDALLERHAESENPIVLGLIARGARAHRARAAASRVRAERGRGRALVPAARQPRADRQVRAPDRAARARPWRIGPARERRGHALARHARRATKTSRSASCTASAAAPLGGCAGRGVLPAARRAVRARCADRRRHIPERSAGGTAGRAAALRPGTLGVQPRHRPRTPSSPSHRFTWCSPHKPRNPRAMPTC